MDSLRDGLDSRRRFLARVGSLAAVAAAVPFGAEAARTADDRQDEDDGHADSATRRVREAYELRVDAARFQRRQPLPPHPTNGDEKRYRNHIGNFSKALSHDPFGIVDPNAYLALVHAMTTGSPADFAEIPLGGVAKLVNPQSALAFQLDGADSHHLGIRIPPTFASAEAAGEIAEDYWLALTRDVPFEDYPTDPTIKAAAASLSSFSDFRGPKQGGKVTPATIFRGSTVGDLTGPYLSQFLLKDVQYGPYLVPQRVRAGLPGKDYMTDYASWLGIQNGAAAPPFQILSQGRYINDNRALAAYLHADFNSQAVINAAQILLPLGLNALSPTNPYRSSSNQAGFVTFGGPELVDLIAHACGIALKACWFQKWSVHRRLRPEAFAGAIHTTKTMTEKFNINHEILDSSVLTAIVNRYGTYLLPMAYPEGSPVHPSYPAGHAVFAGAGATILKAFFDETFVMPSPVVASADGSTLIPYMGPPLTVGNELNKLASNIALGRDATGVHWRSDGVEGINLGEAAAIALLEDLRRCYNEEFAGFTFTKFDGTVITI